MAQRLKRWESPRREGRNHKGKGGSARQRQKRKQFQVLRQRLKNQSNNPNDPSNNQKAERGGKTPPLIFWINRVSNLLLPTPNSLQIAELLFSQKSVDRHHTACPCNGNPKERNQNNRKGCNGFHQWHLE